MGYLRGYPAQSRDLFTVHQAFMSFNETLLFTAHNRKQNTDDYYINGYRNEEMLDALFKLVTMLRVFHARIVSINPSVIRRAQKLLPSQDDDGSQYQSQHGEND